MHSPSIVAFETYRAKYVLGRAREFFPTVGERGAT